MLYSGKYKLTGQIFWRNLKKVKGDSLIDGLKIITFEDDSSIHFPVNQVTIKWNRDRFEDIRNKMEVEAGQPIPIKR